jgi:hypothetical protein
MSIRAHQHELRKVVRDRYAAAATATNIPAAAGRCGPDDAIVSDAQREQFGLAPRPRAELAGDNRCRAQRAGASLGLRARSR